jgi:hypothetical protein
MLVWWFGHLEGDVEIEGRVLDRYRVWHPLDHVSARYVRRAPDGSIGPGAQMRLCEVLARDPRYTIDVVSTIEKLDEDGFIHKVVVRGFELARMEHTFRASSDGVLDENCLVRGFELARMEHTFRASSDGTSLSTPVRRLACEFSERPPSCRRAC